MGERTQDHWDFPENTWYWNCKHKQLCQAEKNRKEISESAQIVQGIKENCVWCMKNPKVWMVY